MKIIELITLNHDCCATCEYLEPIDWQECTLNCPYNNVDRECVECKHFDVGDCGNSSCCDSCEYERGENCPCMEIEEPLKTICKGDNYKKKEA